MATKTVDRPAVTPTTDSLAGGASLLRGLGDTSIKSAPLRSLKNRALPSGLDLKKPPAQGNLQTKYESYKRGPNGGSFPAEVTADLNGKNGASAIVKGKLNAERTKFTDVTSVRVTVPFLGGAGKGGLGAEGNSGIVEVGLSSSNSDQLFAGDEAALLRDLDDRLSALPAGVDRNRLAERFAPVERTRKTQRA